MTPDLGFLIILALAGFGAGFVDSIAGGGGLLTVPALLATGMPPLLALGTNKAQSSVGTAIATWRYSRAGLINWRGLAPSIMFTVLGAALGTWLVQIITIATLKLIIPLLMLGAIIYFIVSPRMTDDDAHQRLSLAAYAPIAGAIGFYGRIHANFDAGTEPGRLNTNDRSLRPQRHAHRHRVASILGKDS